MIWGWRFIGLLECGPLIIMSRTQYIHRIHVQCYCVVYLKTSSPHHCSPLKLCVSTCQLINRSLDQKINGHRSLKKKSRILENHNYSQLPNLCVVPLWINKAETTIWTRNKKIRLNKSEQRMPQTCKNSRNFSNIFQLPVNKDEAAGKRNHWPNWWINFRYGQKIINTAKYVLGQYYKLSSILRKCQRQH